MFVRRLWEDGWKDRYYSQKFDVDRDDIAFRHNVVSAAMRILLEKKGARARVLAYY